jgi:hypothetical protein
LRIVGCDQNHVGFWAAMHPTWCMAEPGLEKETPKSEIRNSKSEIRRADDFARNPANGEVSGPQAEFSAGKGNANRRGHGINFLTDIIVYK